MEQEAASLRGQLLAATRAAADEREQLQRSAAQRQAEWQEQAAALRAEGQQLRAYILAACASLQGLGIPASKASALAMLSCSLCCFA